MCCTISRCAQFRVKMDLVPGMNTFMWLTPTVAGRFEVLCEELCGIGHFAMRGAVVVDEAEDFDRWLAQQTDLSRTDRPGLAGNATIGAAQYAVCAACHGAEGRGQRGAECAEARRSARPGT